MATRGELDEERRSYSAVFVFAVGLLIAGAVWTVWDDNISRRPWKKYQTAYHTLQADKLEQQIAAEQERLDALPDYVALVKGLELERRRLEDPATQRRMKEIQSKIGAAEVDAQQWDLSLRIVKSRIEEAWYEYEHALLTGHASAGAKAELEALQHEKDGIEKALNEKLAVQHQYESELAEIRGEEDVILSRLREFERDKDLLQQRLDGVMIPVGPMRFPKIPKIEQVVLPEFDRGNFDTPLNRVDRCHSCHAAILKAGFEDEPNPLRTHPHIVPLLRQHPVERFGCTTCHAGQGPAVNSPEQAHGEVKFWEDPLLRGDKVQSSCIRCHADARHLPFAETIVRGQVLYEELGCHNCHLTEGYESFAKIGPYLRLASAKLDPAWLVRWVEDPHAFRPTTRMPNFMFSRAEAVAIAAYLLDATRADSQAWLAQHAPPEGVDPSDAHLVSQGRGLVDSLGCRGCHGIAPGESPATLGENKDVAPNLSSIAEKTSGRWLYHWIRNPRGYSPVARMPSLRLSDDEARAITSFLLTLGKPSAGGVTTPELQDADTIEQGAALVRKYGCGGCHDVTGMEKEARIGVELSTFASKPLEELFFGNRSDIPHTWDDWTYNKLKTPRTYETERIEQLMPNFNLTDAEVEALRVFLHSRAEGHIPESYVADTSPRARKIRAGRLLVARYNCAGCHVIEGLGGAIRARYEERPTMAPPVLHREGDKVQAEWLFGFLKEPVPLRPWLQVRMPTFGLSDDEATALVEYFNALDGIETPFVHVVEARISPDSVEAGRLLASDEYFSCFSCHQQGDKKPEGSPEEWAPDLGMARQRLNPDWIPRWIENPQALQPGTKMPAYYPGGPEDVLGGDEQRQREALRDYLLVLGREDAIVARNGTGAAAEADATEATANGTGDGNSDEGGYEG